MKINWFKEIAQKLSLLLNGNNNKSSTSSKENEYFGEQFNEFLKIEDCLFCYQMMDEGYKPSRSTANELNKILIKKLENLQYNYHIKNIKSLDIRTKFVGLINSMNSNKFMDSCRSSGVRYEEIVLKFFEEPKSIEMLVEYVKESMKWLKHYYSSGIDITGDFYSKTSEQNQEVTSHNSNMIYMTNLLMTKELFNSKEIQSIKDCLIEVTEHMENKTVEKHKSASFSRIHKKDLDNFILKIADFQTHQLSKGNRKEELIRQLKSYQSRQVSLTEEMKHLVINEEHSMDNLPAQAKSQVERITNLVNKMNNEEVNDFIKERIPVILKKYFSIDEEYRTTLKNVEGFNAQELMIQSLDNIEKILLAKKEDNNIDLLTELSVENRKIKMKVV